MVPATFRLAAEDFEHNGVTIPGGTRLVLRADAANRDPLVFADPDRLDLTRANHREHLTFGGGPHYCLGANLARAEMQEAVPMLAAAMRDMQLGQGLTWSPYSNIITGPLSMPLTFASSPSPAGTTG